MLVVKRGWGLALVMAGAAAGAAAQQAPLSTAEQEAVDHARHALETRHEWVDGLVVQSVKPAQWRDSSLGCRQPGASYLQVITSGYIVRFAGKGKQHEVHVAGDRSAVCGSFVRQTLKTPAPRVPLRSLDEMIERARADLAMRLGANVADITTVGWKAVQMPARVLRCEVAKGDAGEPEVPGYRIVLAHKAREYTYQSDMQSVTACPRIEAR